MKHYIQNPTELPKYQKIERQLIQVEDDLTNIYEHFTCAAPWRYRSHQKEMLENGIRKLKKFANIKQLTVRVRVTTLLEEFENVKRKPKNE